MSSNQFKELLDQILQLKQFDMRLRRRNLSLYELLKARKEYERSLPLYKIVTDEGVDYVFSEKEYTQKIEALQEPESFDDISGNGDSEESKRPPQIKFQVTEFFESAEIEVILKSLEKEGIDPFKHWPEHEDYLVDFNSDSNHPIEEFDQPIYQLEEKEKKIDLALLPQVLEYVKTSGRRGIDITRYKGLGEMNPDQLWSTTMNPESRTILQVSMDDAVEAENIFTVLMGDAVEPRRAFIQNHAPEVRFLDI